MDKESSDKASCLLSVDQLVAGFSVPITPRSWNLVVSGERLSSASTCGFQGPIFESRHAPSLS